ncbi:MAG: type II toxin-antitoxin system HicB family antitoxin [Burkholderiaceae bacterium]|nr:type II toxin-antitoxin system HicB family antitoxin [Burkholderiaceae bacterium]
MRYAIAIEPGTDGTDWGVVVPDLPGCFAAGDTLAEAMRQAEEAVTAWIEAAIDAEQDIPQPSSINALRAANTDHAGWLWALVNIEPAEHA